MPVDVRGEPPSGLEQRVLEWAERLLAEVDRSEAELSVLLADDRLVQQLNARWRQRDRPTDVLSFPQGGGPPGGPESLGDVVISTQTARRQAEERGHELSAELQVLLVHGLCHLLGYDHQNATAARKMAAAERRLLRCLGVEPQRSLVSRVC